MIRLDCHPSHTLRKKVPSFATHRSASGFWWVETSPLGHFNESLSFSLPRELNVDQARCFHDVTNCELPIPPYATHSWTALIEYCRGNFYVQIISSFGQNSHL